MRLPEVIEAFARDVTLKRAGGATWVDGVATPAAAASSTIRAAVQPLTGRDLMELPEGHRVDEVRLVFSEVELRSLSPSNPADTLVFDGDEWRVVDVAPWTFDGDTHYRAHVSRRAA